MKIIVKGIVFISLSFLLPRFALSELIVHDMITLKGQDAMLTVETRGKLFSKGGEVVEFLVDGKSIGKSLSGGDGYAYKQFIPSKTGVYRLTVKTAKEEDKGLLLSLKKGDRIIFIDVEGSLFDHIFAERPKKGSREVIKKLSKNVPVVMVQTERLGVKAIRQWLKENEFMDLPVVSWRQGLLFDELHGKGLKIRAIIGNAPVIESAKNYKPKALSFEEVEGAEEVKDWVEIGRKLK